MIRSLRRRKEEGIMSEKIARWYRLGLWSAIMVEQAVKKGLLTAGQAGEILGDGYDGE